MKDLNVRENSAMNALDALTVGPFVSPRREVFAVERELSELAVRAPSLEAAVSALSGGNQQKVVVARSMLAQPTILVADEPTQGVDVGARAEIYRILREVSAGGVPVVVASSDALELEGLCDRVIVMSRGHAVATLEGDEVNEERIVHAAISATTHTAEQSARSIGRFVTARTIHRGRLRPGGRSRCGDDRPRRVRPVAERTLPLGFQHHLRDVRLRGPRVHFVGADLRPAARRYRPLRGSARRLPRRGGVLLRPRRQVDLGSGRWDSS